MILRSSGCAAKHAAALGFAAALAACLTPPASAGRAPVHAGRKGKPGAPHGIAWQNNLAAAFKAARKQNRPLLIDFYTDWCGYCKLMDRTTYLDDKVAMLSRKFVAARVNPEKDSAARKIALQANINAFPTLLFVKSNGDILLRAVGYQQPPRLMGEMSQVLNRHTTPAPARQARR